MANQVTFRGAYTQNGGASVAAGTVAITPDGGSTATETLDADGAYSVAINGQGHFTIVETFSGASVNTVVLQAFNGTTVDTGRDVGRVIVAAGGGGGGGGVQLVDGVSPDEGGDVSLGALRAATPSTVTTPDDTFNDSGTWKAVTVADVNAAAIVLAVDGEAFPRVVWVPGDGLYLGDGTGDPIASQTGMELFFAGSYCGINTPASMLLHLGATQFSGDALFSSSALGVVQKAPDASKHRTTVADDGALSTEGIDGAPDWGPAAEADAVLPAAQPFTTTTMANPLTDVPMTVLVPSGDAAVLGIALDGDSGPRLTIDGSTGISFGDGSFSGGHAARLTVGGTGDFDVFCAGLYVNAPVRVLGDLRVGGLTANGTVGVIFNSPDDGLHRILVADDGAPFTEGIDGVPDWGPGASLDSPVFTGTPEAPDPTTNQGLATRAFVAAADAVLVPLPGSPPDYTIDGAAPAAGFTLPAALGSFSGVLLSDALTAIATLQTRVDLLEGLIRGEVERDAVIGIATT